MTRQTNRPCAAVLDDDADLCKLLSVLLRKEYEVLIARNGNDLCHQVDNGKVDIIILDIGLPDEDGITIARRIRATSNVPLVFLSGHSSEDMIVRGLNIGGDDYVTKPFQAEVLLARMRNALRRGKEAKAPARPQQMRSGDVIFDARQLSLTSRDGRSAKLTELETQLLSTLALAEGQTLSREELFRRIHGREWDPLDRSLEVHLSHLRKKLGAVTRMERPIVGIRGVGYRLSVDLIDPAHAAEPGT